MDTFAKRIKKLRDDIEMTQDDLALSLGVARATLASWETGRREPDQQTTCGIADYFNVSVDYLLGRTSIKNVELFIGEKLTKLREAKDLSVKELAKMVDATESSILDWESGKSKPQPSIIKKLSDALKIDEIYFYLRESRLLTELIPDNQIIKYKTKYGADTPYAAVNEKAAQYGISPEILDKLLDIIIDKK